MPLEDREIERLKEIFITRKECQRLIDTNRYKQMETELEELKNQQEVNNDVDAE